MADSPTYLTDEERAERRYGKKTSQHFSGPTNILPRKQEPGKVGTVEGVDVGKEVQEKGIFKTTPKVKGEDIPEGLY